MVGYRTCNGEVAGSTLTWSTASNLEKLITYCVLRSTQPPTLSGITYLLWGECIMWFGGGGMSASCIAVPVVRCRGQWMVALSLARVNELPLQRL